MCIGLVIVVDIGCDSYIHGCGVLWGDSIVVDIGFGSYIRGCGVLWGDSDELDL